MLEGEFRYKYAWSKRDARTRHEEPFGAVAITRSQRVQHNVGNGRVVADVEREPVLIYPGIFRHRDISPGAGNRSCRFARGLALVHEARDNSA